MSRRRLLVVEDHPLNRELMVELLADDYELGFAVDGEQALAKVTETTWDAVLLDIAIPLIDGVEVVTRIRGALGLTELPVIAVTAYAMLGDRERFLAAGCDEHVTKPIDEALLRAALERLLARAR